MPSLPFGAIQQLDLPITEMVGGRIGCIHDAFLTFPYEVHSSLPAGGQDLVLLLGKSHRKARIHELAAYPGRIVAVFAPGDAPLRSNYMPRGQLPPNVVAAFATNNKMPDRRVVSVPLGVRTNKLPHVQFVRQNHQGGRKRLAYANFALNDKHYSPEPSGARHIRARVVDRLQGQPWITMDIGDDHREGAEALTRFYSDVAAHKFVLSPEGNGIDCYRTWEALYLGAIPIVMVSGAMSEFSDLPILFTEDYSELSEEYLEQRWEEMSSRSYEIDRMLKSWYTKRFLEAVATLRQPRFVCWQVDRSPFDRSVRALARSSRSVSDLVVETPTPPFTGPLSFMEPDHWHVVGGLGLSRNGQGLEIRAREEGRRTLEIPLQTIEGAPFRLAAAVCRGEGEPLALTIAVRERSERIAAVETRGEGEVRLDFVARSDRTVLELSATSGDSGCVVLRDLELQALV